MRALSDFELWRKQRDFSTLNRDQAIAYKRHLFDRRGKTSGRPLSASTISHTLRHLQEFFIWLVKQKGARAMEEIAIAYLTPPRRIEMAARSGPGRYVPPLEDVVRVLEKAPRATLVERRDRAAIALTLLTGVRDGALVSLRCKHLDLTKRRLNQVSGEVDTKFGKSIWATFFPVPEVALYAVAEWVADLRELDFGRDEPLFPCSLDAVRLRPVTSSPTLKPWRTAAPVRRILKEACQRAGVRYFVPHAIRNLLARLAVQRCHIIRDLLAWSQNLGHNSIVTTLIVYAELDPDQVADVLERMHGPIDDEEELLRLYMQKSAGDRKVVLDMMRVIR